jgi:putative nucleotidyltransferase with HDIG domain
MSFSNPSRFLSRRNILSIVILICVAIISFAALIQPWSLRQIYHPLVVGDVAIQDLQAPRDMQFPSLILSEAARGQAERAVAPVYLPPEASIARAQSELLQSTLTRISDIRANEEISPEEKMQALANLDTVSLLPGIQNAILGMEDSRWELVKSEAFNLLEKEMLKPVRTEDLESVRNNLASQVSLNLTENEASLVIALVSPLLAANSFYSPELTEQARSAAALSIEPIIRTFVKGQNVVTRGQVVSEADLEALTMLGLIQTQDLAFNYLGAGLLVILLTTLTSLFYSRWRKDSSISLRNYLVLAFIFIIFLAAIRISSPNRTIVPYALPLPAFALLVSSLFGMEHGLVFGFFMSLMAAYGMPDSLALMPYYTISSLCGVLALGQGRRVEQFVFAALVISIAGTAVLVAYRLPFTNMDWVGMITLVGAAFIAGFASTSIALPFQYLLAQFLGSTTALQLLEISRPDSPLLNLLLQRAPGTYQHSLQVANLAEQAADSIHADSLLTRVGALFHDIGKAENPLFFIENQPPDKIDTHDETPPEQTAEIIIQHVPDGLRLGRKYHLPKRVMDFITEHHGTLITRYQYSRALKTSESNSINDDLFRYPGPSPRSKETAILMIADGVEAQARAERPKDEHEARTLVIDVVERCQNDGQLDETSLSQRDLLTIIDSLSDTLRVTYHPRLEYPREERAIKASQVTNPVPEPSPGKDKKKKK